MNIKYLFSVCFVVLTMLGSLFITNASVMANNGFNACDQVVGDAKGSPICEGRDQNGEEELQETVFNVINVLLGKIGALSVIVIIVSGLYFVISQGSPDKIKTAKNALIYSIVGLVVSILSYAIVNFVIDSLL